MILTNSWPRAWANLAAEVPGHELRDALITHYSEPQRHYHTLQHLAECLALFGAKRRAILQGFVDRPRIYSTPQCHALFEHKARSNLQAAIAAHTN